MKKNIVNLPINIDLFFNHAIAEPDFTIANNETNNFIEITNFGEVSQYYVEFICEINNYQYYHFENKIFFKVTPHKDLLYVLNLNNIC